MLNTTDLGYGITCIDTGYTRPEMTACYLMEQGGAAAFIETGVNQNVTGLLELLDQRGIARERVEYVMPTHVHLDHAGGAGALMQALPNAQLVAHPRGARHLIDPAKLVAGATAVYGEQVFNSLYGKLLPIDEERVIQADDGFVIDFHGRTLEFIDTPGHARHHYCIVDKTSDGIFTGDTMGLSYPQLNGKEKFIFPSTSPVQFDPDALHKSIKRIMSYNPGRLYLTHYSCLDNVASLAEQLHNDIDTLVGMVTDTQQDDPDALSIQITEYLRKRALDTGCQLDLDIIDEILSLDSNLNAQGLMFWKETT